MVVVFTEALMLDNIIQNGGELSVRANHQIAWRKPIGESIEAVTNFLTSITQLLYRHRQI